MLLLRCFGHNMDRGKLERIEVIRRAKVKLAKPHLVLSVWKFLEDL